MIVCPDSLEDLSRAVSRAFARGEKVGPVDLAALNRVVEYAPEDMTVTVEGGVTVAALQSELAKKGQWLPMDPPNPQRLTVGALLDTNASGPRRFGFGTIRDHLIGLKVVMADGRLVKSGGKVVKNVAGYDLAKLFVGSQGTLGMVAEATFKLRPLPEAERFVEARRASLQEAGALIDAVLASETTPSVLDLHTLPSAEGSSNAAIRLVLGFSGTRDEVEWQIATAVGLGVGTPSNTNHEQRFWADATPAQRVSVLPSEIIETLRRLGDVPFVARAGNGIVYHRGPAASRQNDLPINLMRRLKEAFDPKQVLPDLTL